MIRPIARLGLLGVALLTVVGLDSSSAQAINYWKNSVVAGNWSNGNNWSSTFGGADNAGAPIAGEAVNISLTDGISHTVTYDVAAPAIGILAIDLIGGGAGATTTATLSLPGNINLPTGGIAVGGYNGAGLTNGRGALIQSGGTTTIIPGKDLIVGWNGGSTGVYTLSGGALVANLNEYVGLSGTGTFNHSGGTNTINAIGAGFLSVGHDAGSTGTYNLSGTGTLSAATHEYIGYGGVGTFNQTGGTNTITSGKNLALGVNSSGAGTYTLSAGSLNVSGREFVGAGGGSTFNQSGGTNTAGSLEVRFGTYNLTGGALSTSDSEFVLFDSVFNHTGGANTIAGGLYVGYFGDSNTNAYNLGGAGSLSTVDEFIGYQGEGTFNQTGGTHTVTGSLRIGDDQPDSFGVYNLSAGQASIASVSVGNSSGAVGVLAVSGTGVLTVGGVLKVHNTFLLDEAWYTSLNLGGGTINTAALDFGGTPSLLNWTSGKLNVTSNVAWDSAAAATSTSAAFGSALVLGSNQTLMVTGNETLGGGGAFALTLNNASTHTVTGGITINPNGALTLSGGTLNTGSLVINGAFNFNSGTLGISGLAGLVVGAGGLLGSTVLIETDQNLNVVNTLTVNSGAYLAVAGGASAGNLLNNGDLVVINTAIDGPVVNSNAITVVGSVDFNGQVSGPGGFFGPGTAHFNGGLAPGASPAEVSFEGSLALADTNTLFIEVGGATPGSEYDRLTIAGSISLGGALAVSLIDAGAGLFAPEAGDTFDILNWGSLSGAFASIDLPTLAGLAWDTSQLYTQGVLSVASSFLEADFNENRFVNAADLTLWKTGFGTSAGATHLQGDANGDFDVDGGDFLTWQRQLGSGPAVAATVPEPDAAILALVGLVALARRRRRGRSPC